MKNQIMQFFLLVLMLVILSWNETSANVLPDESFLKKINGDEDVTSCSITEDNSFFVFSMSDKRGYSSLYFMQYKNGEWDDPKPLNDLNSDFDDVSPYISRDGRLILFSSNRPGGLKSRVDNRQSYDIYYSERNGDGWSKPDLLFGAVNTAYDELYPSISRDGRTLYFSRLIDEDDDLRTIIVSVKKVDDSWEDIQTVEISKNFNADISVYRESMYRPGAYVIARKKDNSDYRGVFFADDSLTPLYENSAADEDEIFVTELNQNKMIVSSNLKGKYKFFIRNVNLEEKKRAAASNILSSNKVSLMIKSDHYTDKSKIKIKVLYFASLKRDAWPVRSDIFSSDKSGMLDVPIASNIQRILIMPGTPDMKAFVYEIIIGWGIPAVTTIKAEPSSEKKFIPKSVYFSYNTTEIDMADIPHLHQLLYLLRDNENLKLELNGYSDGIGSYKSNIDISIKRAEKVKEYLVKSGIKQNRIKTNGFGYVKNSIYGTHQSNRRVDIIVK